MSAHAIPAKAHADPGPHGPGPHDADTQAHRHVLNDLIALGADLARFLHGQAAAHVVQQAAAPLAQQAQPVTDAQPAPQPAPASEALISLALAFDRIARSVRRGILLARSLARPVQPAPDPALVSAQARAAARRQVIRAVEDAIQRPDRGASDGPETLHAELHERLDGPDLDDDISTRPAADIIAEICRDLGLAALPGTRPWKRRTPGDIRQLCAEAAAPSGARQPGAAQPGTSPQAPRRGVAQPTPGPQPGRPAAISPAQPGPIQPGSTPPEDAAGTLATILRRPPRVHGRWRPPPQV